MTIEDIAIQYHKDCDEYDTTVCQHTYADGTGRPFTSDEWSKVNSYALHKRKKNNREIWAQPQRISKNVS